MNPYEALGEELRKHRESMFQLHPALRQLLQEDEMHHWLQPRKQGWSRDEFTALSNYLYHRYQRPQEVEAVLNSTVMWRIESGIPVNRKALSTYCYLLGMEWGFVLKQKEEKGKVIKLKAC